MMPDLGDNVIDEIKSRKNREKRFVWTGKAERIFKGRVKDGQPATSNGHNLTGKDEISKAWSKWGFVREDTRLKARKEK